MDCHSAELILQYHWSGLNWHILMFASFNQWGGLWIATLHFDRIRCKTVPMKRPSVTVCTHLVFRPSTVSGPLPSCYYSTPLSMASNNIKNTLFKTWMDIIRISECYFICFISDFGKEITWNTPQNTNLELEPRSLNKMVHSGLG